MATNQNSHLKFDAKRAQEYATQARIALAGYDACHELSACMLSAASPNNRNANVLVVGAGGIGGEIVSVARLEAGWSFTAVDPSAPMLDLAKVHVEAAGFGKRVRFVCSDLSAISNEAAFDAALVIGILHHIPDEVGKKDLLSEIAIRLRLGASMILAGNYRDYATEPLLLAAWASRWRLAGADESEVRQKLEKIKSGAVPPESEEKLASLLVDAGFAVPKQFFSSLFWGAWHARRVGG